MTVCPHISTFDCHGNPRCSNCYMDAVIRKDGTLRWAAQDDPFSWDADRIVEWFVTERIGREQQGCDGFEFCRQNLLPSRTYGYIWVDVVLDLDMEVAYLLDVRRHNGTSEIRQPLFVGLSSRTHLNWYPTAHKTFESHPTLKDTLYWFADQVDDWIGT